MYPAQAGGGNAGCILDGVEAGVTGCLDLEGVGHELASPWVEVHLHRPRLMSHDPHHPASKERRVGKTKVLHQLAKDDNETSFTLSTGAMVPWAIGRRGSHLQILKQENDQYNLMKVEKYRTRSDE